MFNLVTATIASVILVAVGIAGLTYLGPLFNEVTTKATVAAVLNGGDQIQGAETLRNAERAGYVYDADTLAIQQLMDEGYLASLPQVPQGIALPGSTWSTTAPTPNAAPIVSLELDRSKPAAIAFCEELTRRSSGAYGCTSDLSTVR